MLSPNGRGFEITPPDGFSSRFGSSIGLGLVPVEIGYRCATSGIRVQHRVK